MEQLSPFTRKLIALGLLFVVVLSAINLVILPLFTTLDTRISALQEARLRSARLAAIEQAAPTPMLAPPSPALSFRAMNRAQADAMFASLLRDTSLRTGVAMQMTPVATTASQALTATIEATGSELKLLAFINELERGSPVVRFADWKLAAGSEAAQLRLQATAQAVWRTP